jgi:hypothetical protein
MREQIIAEYHALLASDESLTPELFARLRGMMTAHRLVYGERQIGVALRPHLIARAEYDDLVRSSEVVAGALETVAAALVADPPKMSEVGLTEREQRLALIDPGFRVSAVTTRLDAFLAGGRVKFVEYNAENPSSLMDQSGLNQILFEVGALQKISEHYRLRQFDPAEALLTALVETFREWGGAAEAPNVAIVDWADLPTESEFALLRNYFVGRGVPTVICTPDELDYSQGRLRRGDFTIDVVCKRVIIHELLAHADDTHPLLRAYADGRVCMVNPFRCKIAHKKAAFELLTDDLHAGWFSTAEREVIRRTVPWTRRVRERKTTHTGREVDLVEHVRHNRDLFILKPNDDYGGHGVALGARSTESEWEAALARALAGDYVVQEVVEVPLEEFPVFDEGGWAFQPMYVDTNPFLFRGRVEGAMVRLSGSPIVNVTSGGGETGFFVVEGRAS